MNHLILPFTTFTTLAIVLGFSTGLFFDYQIAKAEELRIECLQDHIYITHDLIQSDTWKENPRIWYIEQFALRCYSTWSTWTYEEYAEQMIQLGYAGYAQKEITNG